MRIGLVAKKFHLPIETLHYWELVGIVPPVNRDASGKRDYDQEDIGWVHFAKCMRLSGVSIKYLQQYIKLFAQGHQTKDKRKKLLKNQLAQIDARLNRLQSCHNLLSWKIKHYDLLDKKYGGKMLNHTAQSKADKS